MGLVTVSSEAPGPHRPQLWMGNPQYEHGAMSALSEAWRSFLFLLFRASQASDSSLLSRLISICSDGRLSSRLFFIL